MFAVRAEARGQIRLEFEMRDAYVGAAEEGAIHLKTSVIAS